MSREIDMLRARPLLVLAATLALPFAGRAASAEDAGCNRWNIEVTCKTDVPRVILGDEFNATVTAHNNGDTALKNVTIKLRGDQGAPCVSGPGTGVTLTLETLEPGASKELTARFGPESVGLARVLGSARDSLGWAAGNCSCTVEVIGLPAITSNMRDQDLSGKDDGVFRVGNEFQYVVDVSNDGGTTATPDLKVVFSLPKEIEFVSGKGEGDVTITGSGQSATTSVFALASPNGKMHLVVRVKAVAASPAPGGLVQTTASIQTVAGVTLAVENESTTVK